MKKLLLTFLVGSSLVLFVACSSGRRAQTSGGTAAAPAAPAAPAPVGGAAGCGAA